MRASDVRQSSGTSSPEKVIGGDTLAIRRIHHNDGLLLRLFELVERLQFQRHIFGYTRCLLYYGLRFHLLSRLLSSVYLVSKLALLTIVIVNLIEHLRIEVHPFLECESFAEYSRAMFLAISAASIGIVPEPHIGSIRSHSPRHPVIRSIPAANTSFNGASKLFLAISATMK